MTPWQERAATVLMSGSLLLFGALVAYTTVWVLYEASRRGWLR